MNALFKNSFLNPKRMLRLNKLAIYSVKFCQNKSLTFLPYLFLKVKCCDWRLKSQRRKNLCGVSSSAEEGDAAKKVGDILCEFLQLGCLVLFIRMLIQVRVGWVVFCCEIFGKSLGLLLCSSRRFKLCYAYFIMQSNYSRMNFGIILRALNYAESNILNTSFIFRVSHFLLRFCSLVPFFCID